ncbi:MAG: hypothetical protein EBS07_00295 [Sphingobacteriia bacterium]|nr:hypothetical protein [Sphingobacteriia bacterium]
MRGVGFVVFLLVFFPLVSKPIPKVLFYKTNPKTTHKWKATPYLIQSEHKDTTPLNFIKAIVVQELSKYPEKLIQKNVKTFWVCSQIKDGENNISGTHHKSSIYLALEDNKDKCSMEKIAQTIHGELATILMNKYSSFFLMEEWNALLLSGLQQSIVINDSMCRQNITLDSLWFEKGFLNEYSACSIENDFHTIAIRVFKPEEDFEKILNRWPILKKKFLLALNFYRKTNARFSIPNFQTQNR